jgi:DNA-binding CsgD family transcriptional regulator
VNQADAIGPDHEASTSIPRGCADLIPQRAPAEIRSRERLACRCIRTPRPLTSSEPLCANSQHTRVTNLNETFTRSSEICVIATSLIAFGFGQQYDLRMPRKSRFTDAETRSILVAHDKGSRLRNICEQFGASHSAIQVILKRSGRHPWPRRVLRGERLGLAISMYRHDGKSYRFIAKQLGVSEWTVRHEIAKAGYQSRSKNRFTPDEEIHIKGRYDAGETSTSLARELSCSEETVRDVILRNGGQMRPKRKLSAQQARAAMKHYAEQRSTSQVAKAFGVNRQTIRNYILRGGGQPRSPREAHRTRALDTRAFRCPGDQGLYWIGFLMADGNVMEKGTLTLGLQATDRAHVKKFRMFLKSDAPIIEKVGNATSYKPGSKAVYFSVCSKDMVEDLAKWGIRYRKSGREELLRDQSSRHVWRGIIDGDGTVRVHKRGYLELKLYGSRALCEQFRSYVLTLVPHCRANVCASRGISCFSLCCSPAEIVASELYKDCSIYLDRKFKAVARFLGWL